MSWIFSFLPVPPAPEQPLEVSPDNITSTSALIEWVEPSEPNGIILSYTVNLVAVSQRSRRRRQVSEVEMCVQGDVDRDLDVPGDQTSLRLSGLSKCFEDWRIMYVRVYTGSFSAVENFISSSWPVMK